MRKFILASHGELSKGMANSAQMIMGDAIAIQCYTLMPGEHPQTICEAIEKEAANHSEDTYIVMVDLFGGSVCNSLMRLANQEHIHIVSGVNLCLLLSIALADASIPIEEVMENAIADAKRNMLYINELRKGKEENFYDQNAAD